MTILRNNVTSHVKDLSGTVVGFVEEPEAGPLRVRLEEPWNWIAEAINRDVQEKRAFLGPDRRLQTVTGTGDADRRAVTHAIRVLSERRLRVVD